MLNKVYCQSCGQPSLFEPLQPKPSFCAQCGKSMVIKGATSTKPATASRSVVQEHPTDPEEPELDPNMKLEYEIEEEGPTRTVTLGQLLESTTPPEEIQKRPPKDPEITLKEFLRSQRNVKDTKESDE